MKLQREEKRRQGSMKLPCTGTLGVERIRVILGCELREKQRRDRREAESNQRKRVRAEGMAV